MPASSHLSCHFLSDVVKSYFIQPSLFYVLINRCSVGKKRIYVYLLGIAP